MFYQSLSLFLLLGSSMAMAMEIPGTGQASAVGQTSASDSALDELKKLFPYATIYRLTDQDKIKETLSTSFQPDSTPYLDIPLPAGGRIFLDFSVPAGVEGRIWSIRFRAVGASKQQIERLTNASGLVTVPVFQPRTLSEEDKAEIKKTFVGRPQIFFAGISIPGTDYVVVAKKIFDGWTNNKEYPYLHSVSGEPFYLRYNFELKRES